MQLSDLAKVAITCTSINMWDIFLEVLFIILMADIGLFNLTVLFWGPLFFLFLLDLFVHFYFLFFIF